MSRLLVIGGSDAGISAALRAREIDSRLEVTVLVADEFPNFSICGLPFFHSGEVADWHSLAHRTLPELEASGASFLLRHRATAIDTHRKTVAVEGPSETTTISYDRLVIATGALPLRPPIPGSSLSRVFYLHSMEDTFRLQEHLKTARPRSAVIVGSGYIGMEMADALKRHGLGVRIVGRTEAVLPTVDPPLGRIVEDELAKHQIEVTNNCSVEAIRETGESLRAIGTAGVAVTGDIILIGAGVRPSTELAARAGVSIGPTGAIAVDRSMQTSVSGVYAAGDCVETWHRMTQSVEYVPLGTTAHKQGVVAGENAAGGHCLFGGSLGTQVVKVFDVAVARTGLRDDEAREAGFAPLTVESKVWDHKKYYPGARELTIRVIGDRKTRRLLGAQIVGHWKAEVAKRIDVFATALYHGMTVDGLNDLDLSYTPPLGSPWDAVQLAAQAWAKTVE